MKSAIPLLASLALLAGGCAVGPTYRPPSVTPPAKWSAPQLGGTTDSAVQVVEWWKTFNDPELDLLIERAVEANHDLRIAEERVREARALRSGAGFDLGPTGDVSAGYAKQQRSQNAQIFLGPLKTDLYDTRFDASWELDIFGGKRRALESADAQLAAIDEDRRDMLVSVLAEVARNYVEVRGLQQRIAIARQNIEAQLEVAELTRARFDAGLTSELDLRQAEALVATTESQLPTMKTTLSQAVHRLGVMLGEEPGSLIAELSAERPIPAVPPEVPVGLPSELVRRRPDVRRAERQLASATADIGVEMAELFPKFSLLGSRGLQSLRSSDWLSGGSDYWSAGPTVSWRLLDFGRIRARVSAANARQAQALAAYEKTVLTSFEEVETALGAYSNEQVRFDSLDQAVLATRSALELANERYARGLEDFLSVLDAERSLYEAENQLTDSQRAVTQNLIALYKALGGGWEVYASF